MESAPQPNISASTPAQKRRGKLHFGWIWKSVLAVAVLLVAARLALPTFVKNYLNKTLSEIPGYKGSVQDVGIALWRGAYQIDGLKLIKIEGLQKEPFVAIEKIDISVDWRSLLDDHALVTKIQLWRPQLQFIEGKSAKQSQTSIDESWEQKVQKLYPFDVNRLVVYDGLVRYKDETKAPKVNIYFDGVDLNVENITNARQSADKLPTTLALNARLLNSGITKLNAKLDLLSEPMDADIKAAIRGLDLRQINNFADAYGKFDFKDGRMDLTMELAASKLSYEGYVKTLVKDVKVLDWTKERKEGKTVGHLLWEGVVGGVIAIFKNHRNGEFAARIPLSGPRSDLKINKWATIGSILSNCFIRALSPRFEDSVRYTDVVGNKGRTMPPKNPLKAPQNAINGNPKGTESGTTSHH